MKQNLDRLKTRWVCNSTKQMYDVAMLNIDGDYAQVQGHFSDEYTPIEEVKISDGVLIQCTGLKDKNGKLIYEGDILEYDLLDSNGNICETDSAKYVVSFEYGGFGMRVCDEYEPDFEYVVEHFGIEEDNSFCEARVIGNIYENPELLKS